MDNEILSEFFEQYQFDQTNLASVAVAAAASKDSFMVLETLETGVSEFNIIPVGPFDEPGFLNLKQDAVSIKIKNKKSMAGDSKKEVTKPILAPTCKKQKICSAINAACSEEGNQKMAHITVERNRRKQMNEHLSILRSLMPCFYVKKGDQASVIGGVVNYISELQLVLQSLEAKKKRKVLGDHILSPRIVSPSPLSPRNPLLTLPVSPRTPPSTNSSTTPYKQTSLPLPPSPPFSTTTSSVDRINELVANSTSAIADVEVKFSGGNVLVQTVSKRIQGQAVKIIGVLENLSFEILQLNINTFHQTMICSFTIKIGIECELSADDLAHLVQQTFCQNFHFCGSIG